MCMPQSPVVGLARWNWEGDRIVHKCIVPSSRPVIGSKGKQYDIDVREFLVSERNEVLARTLEKDVAAFIKRKGASVDRFHSRNAGDFDFRAAIIESFVSATIGYQATDGYDPWQFPDETLSLKRGDCEDRALLLATLLTASGISSYNVRVALGAIRIHAAQHGQFSCDHAWVMYKNEAGRWTLMDPLRGSKVIRAPKSLRPVRVRGRFKQSVYSAEYTPSFVFNSAHLWAVGEQAHKQSPEHGLRRDWSRLHPEFSGEIHQSIMVAALGATHAPDWLRIEVNRQFTSLFGNVIDSPDMFPSRGYDSLDHFDNAFIKDGWDRVTQRLAWFKQDNRTQVDKFVWAAHSIADFYAHSSYAHFARQEAGGVALYDPGHPLAGYPRGVTPEYSAARDFDLASGQFTVNENTDVKRSEIPATWAGQIISGRYCQPGDHKSLLEGLTPVPGNIQRPGDRMTLPHHNEIAVDGQQLEKAHVLYRKNPRFTYDRQFILRKDAAIRHIEQAFTQSYIP